MRNARLSSVLFLSAALFSILSCSRSQDAVLTIQLPEASPFSSKTMNSLTSTSSGIDEDIPWNGTSVESSSDINCYVVMVGGPERLMKKNRCWNGSYETLFEFGPFEGGVPAGSNIELSVPPGSGREIYLLGANANSGYCKSFKNDGLVHGQVSFPRLVATTTVDLTPGENKIDLNVPSDLTSLPEIQNCKVDDDPVHVDLKTSIFGDGRDGDLAVLSSAALVNSTNYNDSGVFTHNGGDVPDSKIFSAARQVTGVDHSTGRFLTLGTSIASNGDDFDVDDEVMWYVSQGATSSPGTTPPDDYACGHGSELYRGRFGFAKVREKTTTTLVLDRPISPDPSKIVNANLSTTAHSNNDDHCRIQVVRVPSFGTLSVPSGGIGAILKPDAYNPTTGVGGIIVFRAQRIDVDSSSSLTINASGTGYQGVSSASGAGTEGIASSSSSTANGAGGGFSTKGGGGGGGGSGGNTKEVTSGTPYAYGGQAITYCKDKNGDGSQDACLPAADHKAFFGGSGGGGGSSYGHGGGLVMVYAYEVTGGSTFNIEASGASGLSSTGGGGAGGSIHFSNAKAPVTAIIDLVAKGGTAIDGGGGGGGVVEHSYCTDYSHPTVSSTSTTATPGGTSSTGSAGGNGLFSSNAHLFCSL